MFYKADLGQLQSKSTALVYNRHVCLTQGRQEWQAEAQQPALHCRRADLGP